MKCPKCEKEIEADSKFCAFCGGKITGEKEKEKTIEPTDRAAKIYIRANEMIHGWASDDEKDEEYKNINKILSEMSNEVFLRYMAFIDKQSTEILIPDFREKDFGQISDLGYGAYWVTYHGYIFALAEMEIDKKELKQKVKNLSELSDKYDSYKIKTSEDFNRCRGAFVNSKMEYFEESLPEFKELNHKIYQDISIAIGQSFNSGYAIAKVMWG